MMKFMRVGIDAKGNPTRDVSDGSAHALIFYGEPAVDQKTLIVCAEAMNEYVHLFNVREDNVRILSGIVTDMWLFSGYPIETPRDFQLLKYCLDAGSTVICTMNVKNQDDVLRLFNQLLIQYAEF